MINRFVRRGVPALALVPLLLAGPAAVRPDPAAADSAPRARTPVQLLALNDLHGNLLPVEGAAGRITHRGPAIQAGGLAQLATLLDEARAGRPNTLTVGAGDMIGGSPLLSALFTTSRRSTPSKSSASVSPPSATTSSTRARPSCGGWSAAAAIPRTAAPPTPPTRARTSPISPPM